jgi:hypothetical protein
MKPIVLQIFKVMAMLIAVFFIVVFTAFISALAVECFIDILEKVSSRKWLW